MKLPESRHDRRVRDEALVRLGKRVAIVGVPTLLVGSLTHALGVPWWMVLIAALVIVCFGVFEA
ncbi:unannotated protein [freshwater metagenome]|uniref:Unannotated protein n=1 Tax=freshwater metagenome TaxID=449393 RepID=A0A6J7MKW5_9ZZZZ